MLFDSFLILKPSPIERDLVANDFFGDDLPDPASLSALSSFSGEWSRIRLADRSSLKGFTQGLETTVITLTFADGEKRYCFCRPVERGLPQVGTVSDLGSFTVPVGAMIVLITRQQCGGFFYSLMELLAATQLSEDPVAPTPYDQVSSMTKRLLRGLLCRPPQPGLRIHVRGPINLLMPVSRAGAGRLKPTGPTRGLLGQAEEAMSPARMLCIDLASPEPSPQPSPSPSRDPSCSGRAQREGSGSPSSASTTPLLELPLIDLLLSEGGTGDKAAWGEVTPDAAEEAEDEEDEDEPATSGPSFDSPSLALVSEKSRAQLAGSSDGKSQPPSVRKKAAAPDGGLSFEEQLSIAIEESKRTYALDEERRASGGGATTSASGAAAGPYVGSAPPSGRPTGALLSLPDLPWDLNESHPLLGPLLWYCSAPMLSILFKALLLERRVVITSRSVSVVSSVVLAAEALLRPLRFSIGGNIFLPFLPDSAKDVLCAPVPFLVGISGNLAHSLDKLDMELSLVLDLDAGTHRYTGRNAAAVANPDVSVRERFAELHTRRGPSLFRGIRNRLTRMTSSRGFHATGSPGSPTPGPTSPSPDPELVDEDLLVGDSFSLDLIHLPQWLEKSLRSLTSSIEGPLDRSADEPLRRLIAEFFMQVLGYSLPTFVFPRTRALEDAATSRVEVGWSLDNSAPPTFLVGDQTLSWSDYLATRPPAAALLLRAARHTHTLTELLRVLVTGVPSTGSEAAFLKEMNRRAQHLDATAALEKLAVAEQQQRPGSASEQGRDTAEATSRGASASGGAALGRMRSSSGAAAAPADAAEQSSAPPDLSWEARIRESTGGLGASFSGAAALDSYDTDSTHGPSTLEQSPSPLPSPNPLAAPPRPLFERSISMSANGKAMFGLPSGMPELFQSKSPRASGFGGPSPAGPGAAPFQRSVSSSVSGLRSPHQQY